MVNYGGRAADVWWERNRQALARLKNLTVLDIPSAAVDALPGLLQRSMRLNCLVQDGEFQLMAEDASVDIRPVLRVAATA